MTIHHNVSLHCRWRREGTWGLGDWGTQSEKGTWGCARVESAESPSPQSPSPLSPHRSHFRVHAMAYATRDGVRLYWEEVGHGEPLLLIMGLGATHEWWGRVTPAVAPHFRTIVFDNRGVGNSDV